MPLTDGGPAFPWVSENDRASNVIDAFGTHLAPGFSMQYHGMTLRDAYVIAALPAVIAAQARQPEPAGMSDTMLIQAAAAWAWAYADALLATRSKT